MPTIKVVQLQSLSRLLYDLVIPRSLFEHKYNYSPASGIFYKKLSQLKLLYLKELDIEGIKDIAV